MLQQTCSGKYIMTIDIDGLAKDKVITDGFDKTFTYVDEKIKGFQQACWLKAGICLAVKKRYGEGRKLYAV